MAPRRRRPPGAVLLWPQQVAPEYHRKPVPLMFPLSSSIFKWKHQIRSRQAQSAHKAQSFADGIDGCVDVSAHDTLQDHGRCDRSDGSFVAGCCFDIAWGLRDAPNSYIIIFINYILKNLWLCIRLLICIVMMLKTNKRHLVILLIY